MPILHRIVVTALKDTKIVTGEKDLEYRPVEGLPGGMPEGQERRYAQVHGLGLLKDQTVELDVTDKQLDRIQQSVDEGDIEVTVMEDTGNLPKARPLRASGIRRGETRPGDVKPGDSPPPDTSAKSKH